MKKLSSFSGQFTPKLGGQFGLELHGHFDRFFQLLKHSKINCSMTESYDPYANAVAERINGILKGEFIGYKNKCSLNTMEKLIKNSIEIYNEVRPHYSCFYKTPKQMHQQNKNL